MNPNCSLFRILLGDAEFNLEIAMSFKFPPAFAHLRSDFNYYI